MATFGGASSINLHSHLIKWSCKVTWTIRSVISLLQQGLRQPNFAKWWLWEASTHKVTQHFEHAVTWRHVAHEEHISTTTMPMDTKSGRDVTYNEELPSIKSEDPLIMWSARSREKLNMLYLHYHNDYDYQAW